MNIGEQLLYLSKAEVQAAAPSMEACIDALEEAYMAKSRNQVELPPRPVLGDVAKQGFLKAYAGSIAGTDRLGVKWLGASRHNAGKGLPSITGLIILNDPETMCPVAIMDCGHITGLRTAGVSGIAMRHLVKNPCRSMTILGCGLQGRTHLAAAVSACKDLATVRAWSPNLASSSRFVDEMKRIYPQLELLPVEDAKQAVRQADLVVSSVPFGGPEEFAMIHEDWIEPGVTVISISISSHFYPDGLFAFDRYCVDDKTTLNRVVSRPECERAGELPLLELGDVLLGKVTGRQTNEERILVMTEGLGINDIAVGRLVYERAVEQKIGTVLAL